MARSTATYSGRKNGDDVLDCTQWQKRHNDRERAELEELVKHIKQLKGDVVTSEDGDEVGQHLRLERLGGGLALPHPRIELW